MNSRLEKLEKLRESNVDPYPRDFPNRDSIKTIITEFNVACNLKELNKISNKSYRVAGRIMSCRNHGHNIFFDIVDSTDKIQLHAKFTNEKEDSTIEHLWEIINECDLGDCVGVEGKLTQNPRDEPLLLISNWTLLAKALIEPPDKRHGIIDPEIKYRHRERDLLSSADSRALFRARAEIIFEIRKYFNEKEFIEIEAPTLQPIYGGATARPFVTKHNALNQQFYLGISSELYLKRALVGGYDKVYSISRCFRNEGISPEHNPEFTNLEIFETCKTSQDMEIFVINLWDHLYKDFNTNKNLHSFQFMKNLESKDWPLSRTLADKEYQDPHNLHMNPREYADAWELFINDMEIASGASDLNDPHEQEERLKESEKKSFEAVTDLNDPRIRAERVDYDPYDKNYIEALEMGALPWAGVGIGIDRLVMLLTGKTNIRDVLLFPTLKNL